MAKIDTILADERLDALRKGYKREEMTRILSGGLPGLDDDTASYIATIREQFYQRAPRQMHPQHRERVLIGVLVSRDAGLNLALHVYIGLMERLSPHDIADIIFLSGVYTGVDCISDGLDTVTRTLDVLSQLAQKGRCTVVQVATELRDAFKPQPHTVK
jgi:hypothetical protein